MRLRPSLMITVVLVLIRIQGTQAQSTITLLDGKTGEPVSFAQICFESLDKTILENHISDEQGRVSFEHDLPFHYAASAMGYKTLLDTIRVPGNFTRRMAHSVIDMEGVVVTAQYSPRKADQSIYQVGVIDNRMIRQKGAVDLAQALDNELGIRISNDAALGTSMSIQGLTGENVKILIDGVPVIGRMNGNIDLSQINMHNVDHIEVVEGPMSVVYGSNALAGAVNIITREDTRSRFSAFANTHLETVGVYNFDMGGGLSFGKNSVSLSGSRNFFNGFSDPDTSRSKQWKPRLQYNLDGYYKYSGERLGLKMELRYFDETIQNKGPLLPPYREKAFDTWYYTTRVTDRIQADYRFSGKRLVDAVFAHSHYSRVKNTFFKDLTTLEETMLQSESDNDTTGFNSYLVRGTFTDEELSDKLSYQAGTDINLETGEGRRLQEGSQFIGDYAAFASLNWAPSGQLAFQPGIRYAYNTRYKSPLVPSLNLKYQVGRPAHIIRASYARGFRAPSLKELYLYFVDINHNLRGNPDLEAEYSHNFNLTWDHTRDHSTSRYTFQAGGFYNAINNRITLALDSATLYSYVNVDRYRTAGGKLNFKYNLHPRFIFQAGVYQIARQSIIGEGSSSRTPFRHSTDLTASTSYHWMSRNIRLYISYKYTGRQPQFYSNAEGGIEEGFIEAYHMLDCSISRGWWNERITTSIGANNLLNYTNIVSSGLSTGAHSGGTGSYPVGWGRSFYLALRFNFQQF